MSVLQECEAWRNAAIADGWLHKPTYAKSEGEDRHCTLNREGYTAMINARDNRQCNVMLWGPDGLVIEPPNPYDWELITYRTHICEYCNQWFEKTVRIGFAGRCCPECRKKHVAEIEYPGWCN